MRRLKSHSLLQGIVLGLWPPCLRRTSLKVGRSKSSFALLMYGRTNGRVETRIQGGEWVKSAYSLMSAQMGVAQIAD